MINSEIPRPYPIALDLHNQPCLVVGGGPVARRKVDGLLQSRAAVMVVAPRVVPTLEELARTTTIHWAEREFRLTDVLGMRLVFAATDSPEVNATVVRAARENSILCSRADAGPGGDFAGMSILQRGELMIAISTGGDSPALARWIREKVEAQFGPEYGLFLDQLSPLREEVKAAVPASERSSRWIRALHSDAFEFFCAGQVDDAIRMLRVELGLDAPPENQVR